MGRTYPSHLAAQAAALAGSTRRFGRRSDPEVAARPAGVARQPAPLTTFLFILLVIFLVAFPKGGVKVGNLPITIGYVTLGLLTALSYFRVLSNLTNLPAASMTAWATTVPFQIIVLLTFVFLGFRGGNNAIGIAVLTTFVFMPNAFLLFFSVSVPRIDPETIKRVLVFAIRFICLFGLLLFLVKTFTGFSIEIPFLTVNLDDASAIETKNNTRGALFKMISTYNNGNIFGVCLGMMLPMYYFMEKRRLFFLLAVACMLFTLSRTAWAALIVALAAIAWVDAMRPGRIIALGGIGLILIAALPLILEAMGRDSSFLVDSNLGGRESQLAVFSTFMLEPREGLGAIYEITYASIYRNYGLVGLITFLIYLAGPILVVLSGPKGKQLFNRSAIAGLGTYIITAVSDGATLLIPTMAIYFFISVLALEVDDRDPGAATILPPGPSAGSLSRWRRPSLLRRG